MNLLCTDAPTCVKRHDGKRIPDSGPDPVIGNEYTSYDECQGPDGLYYFLVGFPDDFAYHSKLFATLPDTSADEMADEKHEAIANLEPVKC